MSTRNRRLELRFLTLTDAAEILQISKRTLMRLIKDRKIPASKVGGQWRIREGQLIKWADHNENLIRESEQ